MEHDSKSVIILRKPNINDGIAIYELVKESPPLDLNSSYLYFLQATHFADTCIVAEQNGQLLGFVSGYFRPDKQDSLFIWQVAVSQQARNQGLGKRMLYQLLINQERRPIVKELCCTISPSNVASTNLFKSFAEQYRLHLETEAFLEEDHFGNLGHEAEELYILRAPFKQNIINSLL